MPFNGGGLVFNYSPVIRKCKLGFLRISCQNMLIKVDRLLLLYNYVDSEERREQSVKIACSPSKSISSEIYVETVTHISADITEVLYSSAPGRHTHVFI